MHSSERAPEKRFAPTISSKRDNRADLPAMKYSRRSCVKQPRRSRKPSCLISLASTRPWHMTRVSAREAHTLVRLAGELSLRQLALLGFIQAREYGGAAGA